MKQYYFNRVMLGLISFAAYHSMQAVEQAAGLVENPTVSASILSLNEELSKSGNIIEAQFVEKLAGKSAEDYTNALAQRIGQLSLEKVKENKSFGKKRTMRKPTTTPTTEAETLGESPAQYLAEELDLAEQVAFARQIEARAKKVAAIYRAELARLRKGAQQ